jgi:hypothetical protein
MLLSKLSCDACGRAPSFVEWWKGELTAQGYPDWRHPGVAFNMAGVAVNHEGHQKIPAYFQRVFGSPYPEDPSFLCPQCQERVMELVPELLALDQEVPPPAPEPTPHPAKPRFRLGEEERM